MDIGFQHVMCRMLTGANAAGMDPITGTGAANDFLDNAVAPRPSRSRALLHTTIIMRVRRPMAMAGASPGYGAEPTQGIIAWPGAATAAEPAAGSTNGSTGSQQAMAALAGARAHAAAASGSAGSAAAPGPSGAAGAAAGTPTSAPGSNGTAGAGPEAREEALGAPESQRFSLRGLWDAASVDFVFQTVGSFVEPTTVDRVLGLSAAARVQPVGMLPVDEQAQLLDPYAARRFMRMLKVLERMGLVAAEVHERGAPAMALTYIASPLAVLEEPANLADHGPQGGPPDVIVPAATSALAAPGAPDVQPLRGIARGCFRKRESEYDVREAGTALGYWAHLQDLGTRPPTGMEWCFPATVERAVVAPHGWVGTVSTGPEQPRARRLPSQADDPTALEVARSGQIADAQQPSIGMARPPPCPQHKARAPWGMQMWRNTISVWGRFGSLRSSIAAATRCGGICRVPSRCAAP